MGQRLLEIDPTLIVELLKGMHYGPNRFYQVTQNPIPQDAVIRSISYSPYKTDSVEVLLESESWEGNNPRTIINPQLKVVEQVDSVTVAGCHAYPTAEELEKLRVEWERLYMGVGYEYTL